MTEDTGVSRGGGHWPEYGVSPLGSPRSAPLQVHVSRCRGISSKEASERHVLKRGGCASEGRSSGLRAQSECRVSPRCVQGWLCGPLRAAFGSWQMCAWVWQVCARAVLAGRGERNKCVHRPRVSLSWVTREWRQSNGAAQGPWHLGTHRCSREAAAWQQRRYGAFSLHQARGSLLSASQERDSMFKQ